MVQLAPAPAAIAAGEAPSPAAGPAAGDVAMKEASQLAAPSGEANAAAASTAASSSSPAAASVDDWSALANRLATKRRQESSELPPAKAVRASDTEIMYVMEVAANEEKLNPRVSRAGLWEDDELKQAH